MNLQLVTFETAVLAKEKKFLNKNQGYEYIDKSGDFHYTNTEGGISGKEITVQIVEQELLKMWLRQEHNIIIEIIYDETQSDTFVWLIGGIYFNNINLINGNHLLFGDYFDNYEECLEIALEYGLNLIKSF